jgi:hypothetical protein
MCNIGLKVLKARDVASHPKITDDYEWIAKARPDLLHSPNSLVAIQPLLPLASA